MLVLAVHEVDQVSARIPMSMLVLSKALDSAPPWLKSRFLIPTSGTVSVSMWDATDCETLQSWLDETLSEYCKTSCFEAVEEFSQGLSVELARLRVSENVSQKTGAAAATVGEKAGAALSVTATTTRTALGKVGQAVGSRLNEIGQNPQVSKIKEKTGVAATTTRTALGKVGMAAAQTRDRAMKNKAVASGVQQINSGVRTGFSFVRNAFDAVVKSVQEIDEEDKKPEPTEEEMLNQALEEQEEEDAAAKLKKEAEEYFAGFDEAEGEAEGGEAQDADAPQHHQEAPQDTQEPAKTEEPAKPEVAEEVGGLSKEKEEETAAPVAAAAEQD